MLKNLDFGLRVTRNPKLAIFKFPDLTVTTYLPWENRRPFYKSTLYYRLY